MRFQLQCIMQLDGAKIEIGTYAAFLRKTETIMVFTERNKPKKSIYKCFHLDSYNVCDFYVILKRAVFK